ncbi:glycosyltransferase [Acidobacteria bacterium AH-259-A15]|nr:glycosyltransferase [Acidobacteria bacterium AH-259-A15]
MKGMKMPAIDVESAPTLKTEYQRLTVIIPTLNEANTIGKLLDNLVQRYPGINVIVADDDSTDGTREEVMAQACSYSRIRLLWRKGKIPGLTASVLEALNLVSTDYFAVMDGDLQHPPKTIEQLLRALTMGYTLAVARRVRYGLPPHRYLVSKVGTLMGRLRLWWSDSARCSDCMSGYFAGRTALFREVLGTHANCFELPGYKVLFDFLKQLPRHTPVAEVDYEFDERSFGKSKISARIMLIYVRSLFR